ncbi:MAG TPA: hypothetical protein VL126_09785 [Bacteroidota bacterium]|nr:hypothetical protein [Bacteroidota bacterium]
MAQRGHRLRVIATAVSFLWTGVMVEVSHHDVTAGGSRAILTSHDCGSHEIHISVDQVHQCLACALSGQRVSLPPTILPLNPTFEMMLPAPRCCVGHPIMVSYLFSGKRGPPIS